MTAPRPTDDPDLRANQRDALIDWRRYANTLRLALAAVERERDEARRVGRLDGREANNLLVWAEGAEERVNAAVARAVAAEARLAAVERAIPSILAPIDTIRHSLDCTMRPVIYNGARCSCDLSSHIRRAVQAELHAALAAPSPQAEPAENPWCERCPTSNEINNASHKAWHARWDAAQAEPAR